MSRALTFARPAAAFAAILALAALISPPPAQAARSERIVSLVPSVTETIFALGAGSEVVGVSRYCDYPQAALKLPRVGSFETPDIEEIAGLRPTLIVGLGMSSNQQAIRALRSMGYATLMVNEGTLEQIENSITEIGDRIGRGAQARALRRRIEAQIETVRRRISGAKPVRVLMLVGHQPMVAVGRGTYLDQLIAIAGGINIADASAEQWPRLSLEYVIAMRPQVILDGQMGNEKGEPDGFWRRYSTIPAVRDHRVYGYPQNPVLHPGPRVGQTLKILAQLIHPARFPSAAGQPAEALR